MPVNQNTTKWNDDNMARFRELYATGASYSVMAAKLNAEFGTTFTRHACIGRAHRQKFDRRPTIVGETMARPRRERKYRPGAVPHGWKKTPFGIHPLEEPQYSSGDPSGPGITINMLRKTTCRWPVVDIGPATFLFCGLRSEEDLPYCKHHHTIGTRIRQGGVRASY